MISTIKDFGGYVFKTIGDCVLGFFVETGGFQWVDNAFVCGLMLIEVVREVVTPFLVSRDLPRLECRVGADYGEVVAVKTVRRVPFEIEAVGDVLNLAAKIQGKARPNSMSVGKRLAELIHTDFRLACNLQGTIPLNGEEYEYYEVKYRI